NRVIGADCVNARLLVVHRRPLAACARYAGLLPRSASTLATGRVWILAPGPTRNLTYLKPKRAWRETCTPSLLRVTLSSSSCWDSRVSMSRHENSLSARVGSDAAIWGRFLARNTSRNLDVETARVASARLGSLKSYAMHAVRYHVHPSTVA